MVPTTEEDNEDLIIQDTDELVWEEVQVWEDDLLDLIIPDLDEEISY